VALPRRGDKCGTDIHGDYLSFSRAGKVRCILARAATNLEDVLRASAGHDRSEPSGSPLRA
jgi:hypothetical protein